MPKPMQGYYSAQLQCVESMPKVKQGRHSAARAIAKRNKLRARKSY